MISNKNSQQQCFVIKKKKYCFQSIQLKFFTRLFLEWYDYVLNSVFFHNISSFFWECVIGKNSRLFEVCVCVYYLILCIEHDDEEIWDDYLLCAFFSFNNTRVRVVGRDDMYLSDDFLYFLCISRKRERSF